MIFHDRPRDVLSAISIGEQYTKCIELHRSSGPFDDLAFIYFAGLYWRLICRRLGLDQARSFHPDDLSSIRLFQEAIRR